MSSPRATGMIVDTYTSGQIAPFDSVLMPEALKHFRVKHVVSLSCLECGVRREQGDELPPGRPHWLRVGMANSARLSPMSSGLKAQATGCQQ